MIHVNVKRSKTADEYIVEVSCDGAAWLEHWHLPPRGANEAEEQINATSDARIYAAGIKFGGAKVRMTAFGGEIYVPDMATISHRRST